MSLARLTRESFKVGFYIFIIIYYLARVPNLCDHNTVLAGFRHGQHAGRTKNQ